MQIVVVIMHALFLSTLSLRRATGCFGRFAVDPAYFYPRSPCGERQWIHHARPTANTISIHALLAESDTFINCNSNFFQKFLSTLSLRRATTHPITILVRVVISIHALLAESDTERPVESRSNILFLSTLSLRRATILGNVVVGLRMSFLSTLSLRRATTSKESNRPE